VSVESSRCPFCGGACVAVAPLPSPTRRLARNALASFATLAIAGCGSTEDMPVPVYGAPADTGMVSDSSMDTGAVDSSADTANDTANDTSDTGGIAPPYGIPPEDGGVE
jgi:hypothetical protein